MALLRRVNLDLFWSRESSTITGNFGKVKKVMDLWSDRNNHGPLPAITPWEEADTMGMSTAISMLEHSLDMGPNSIPVEKLEVQCQIPIMHLL